MFYTEAEIDRMAEKRSDPEFIAARLSDPDTVLLPVWRGQNLIDESGDTPRAGGFSVAEGGMLLEEGGGGRKVVLEAPKQSIGRSARRRATSLSKDASRPRSSGEEDV